MANLEINDLVNKVALATDELEVQATGGGASNKVTALSLLGITSPTLVTPNLGIPSAGSLVNCTGLPPAGVTGTAAILGANTFPATQTIQGKLALAEGALRGFTLSTRDALAGILPVPSFRPTDADTTLALDVMPNGSPAEYGTNGYAWIDVCDTDVLTTNPAVVCARIGARSGGMEFGSRALNGAASKPVWITVDGVVAITVEAASNYVTFARSVTIAEAAGTSALTINGATQTSSRPVINATQTWNSIGTTFTGIKLDVTDTTSATASLLMDLQVGGATKLSLRKDGYFVTNLSTVSNLQAGGNVVLQSNGGGVYFGSGNDGIITRPAAATIQQGAADVAGAPVAQTTRVQSASGVSNTAGANWTLQASAGTGDQAGGSLIFQVAPLGSSGSTKNAYATALTIDSTKLATFAGAIAIANSLNVVSPTAPNRTITMVVGGTTVYIAAKTTND